MHCKNYSHFFSKKFQHTCVSLDANFNESLTKDIVSFEQLGPDKYFPYFSMKTYTVYIIIRSALVSTIYGLGRLHYFSVEKNKTTQKTPYESFMIQTVRLGCLNSVRIVFFSFLSEKESAKRKKGSKLFPFRVDPFQKGLGWNVSSCFYLLQHHHHHHHNHQGPVVQS